MEVKPILHEGAPLSDARREEMGLDDPFQGEDSIDLSGHPEFADMAPGDEAVEEGMDDEQIKTILQHEIEQASGYYDSELARNRIAAYRYIRGEMKRAPAGRSNAVSTDVADTIEWTIPQVMDALASGNVVELEAVGEDDEDQAQLETDAVEHVIFNENEGFLHIQSGARDALALKNGVLKVFWDERKKVRVESYTGLTPSELAQLMNPVDGSEVTPLEHEVYPGPQQQPEMNPGMPPEAGMQQQPPQMLYDVRIRRVRVNGVCNISPMPMDEFILCRDHSRPDLNEVRFCAHRQIVYKSDLVAEGWDRDVVDNLPHWTMDDTEGEREERQPFQDTQRIGMESLDPSMHQVMRYECYAMVDTDGDGLAELIVAHLAGDEGGLEMLGWEHTDDHPFVGATAIMATHRFDGVSLFDRVWEIQHQKTQILRSLQDNLDHQNNARNAVVAGQVNLDDLLTNRPGGIVRQKAPGMIEPLVAPQIGEWGYRHLDWLDNVRTGRAGVSPDTAAVADALAGDTAHGLERLMSAKEELTTLMVKMLAETMVKHLTLKTRAILQKHRTTPIQFKKRQKWEEVDPNEWRDRTSAKVRRALSHGDRMKQQMALTQVLAQQEKAIAAGSIITNETRVYNAVTEFVRNTSLDDPSAFWVDPDSDEGKKAAEAREKQQQEAQEREQNAQEMVLKTQAAIEDSKQATAKLKAALDAEQKGLDRIAAMQELLENLEFKYTELEAKLAMDVPGKGMEAGAVPDEAPATFPESWGEG